MRNKEKARDWKYSLQSCENKIRKEKRRKLSRVKSLGNIMRVLNELKQAGLSKA